MVLLTVLALLSVVLAVTSDQDAGAIPAAGSTPTATTPATPPPPADARDVRDTCAEALRQATALLDAQEEALDAHDDGLIDDFLTERTEAREFNRAGLHQAAENCRNAA